MPSTYFEKLLSTHQLREPVLRNAIKALEQPEGSAGLDVGCGAGLQCLMLAEAVGEQGHVTGLDVSPEFLAHGTELVKLAGLSDRISFVKADAADMPFDDDSFDWVWSVDCVGYGPWEPIPLLQEMKRVIRPGGKLVLLAWVSEKLLPGYPLLEARLGATIQGITPATADMDPSRHFHRALGWLCELGLQNLSAMTFTRSSVQAPLSNELYKGLEELITMRWEGAENQLSAEDRELFGKICKPDSPDFILRIPDYFAFFNYAMFSGIVR